MKEVFCWKDKTTWPSNWPGCEIEPNSDEAYELIPRFKSKYDFFIAYHACRAIDVSSYYEKGLRIANHKALLQRAIKIFVDGMCDEITYDDVVLADKEMPWANDPRLYVALDDRNIIKWCGHYLIYGSEYITGIAVALSSKYGSDYKQYLKNFGRPTMFELQLAVSCMPYDCLAELCSCISRSIFYDEIACLKDFAVALSKSVPPESILSHYHPNPIYDPLLRIDYCW